MTIKAYKGSSKHRNGIPRLNAREYKTPKPNKPVGEQIEFFNEKFGRFEVKKMIRDGRLVWVSRGRYVEKTDDIDVSIYKKRALYYGKRK